MREWFITLPEPLILLNPWQRLHWRARKRYMAKMAWQIREQAKPPQIALQAVSVHIRRYSIGEPDPDGLIVKPLLDCLVVASKRNPHGLGWCVDDSAKHMTHEIVPVRVKRRWEQRTEVTILEIEP